MSGFLGTVVLAFSFSQAAALAALWLGRRLRSTPVLRRLGGEAHARKRRALETMWPLTQVTRALERGEGATVAVILTLLILLKSALTFVFGAIAVITLPLSSLTVAAIAEAEAPGDAGLLACLERISILQVTSHVLAAAAGLAIIVRGPLAGRSLAGVMGENEAVLLTVLSLSALFAIAAGRSEAQLVRTRGL